MDGVLPDLGFVEGCCDEARFAFSSFRKISCASPARRWPLYSAKAQRRLVS